MSKNILFIISLSINFILACLLFFKSALNEILKEWWLQRQSARKDKQKRLSDIRMSLLKLKASFPYLLLDIAIAKEDPKLASETRASHFKETANAFKQANENLRENEIYCDDETQYLLKELTKTFEDSSSIILSSNTDKKNLLSMIEELSNNIEIIIDKVEKQIKAT